MKQLTYERYNHRIEDTVGMMSFPPQERIREDHVNKTSNHPLLINIQVCDSLGLVLIWAINRTDSGQICSVNDVSEMGRSKVNGFT